MLEQPYEIVPVIPRAGGPAVARPARMLTVTPAYSLFRCVALVLDGTDYRECRSHAELDREGHPVCRSHHKAAQVLVTLA